MIQQAVQQPDSKPMDWIAMTGTMQSSGGGLRTLKSISHFHLGVMMRTSAELHTGILLARAVNWPKHLANELHIHP